MKPQAELNCTAFQETKILATGKLVDVALAAREALQENPKANVFVFDDHTGQQIEFDYRGTEEKFLDRLKSLIGVPAEEDKPGPGRPKLGVVSREIGLLPRHWDWLAQQPGGASNTLRKLVEDASKKNSNRDEVRRVQNATYRFMTIMAGDFPNYEEALRAFYARDRAKFEKHMAQWPEDIREHSLRLAEPAL